jgi:hypothetical protein
MRLRPRRVSADLLLNIALVLGVLAVLTVCAGNAAHALQAAGLTSKTGAIGGIDTFVSSLTDNVKWLVATFIVLSIAVVGLLFAMGHTRAHDIAIKAGIGAAIIVGLGGISK